MTIFLIPLLFLSVFVGSTPVKAEHGNMVSYLLACTQGFLRHEFIDLRISVAYCSEGTNVIEYSSVGDVLAADLSDIAYVFAECYPVLTAPSTTIVSDSYVFGCSDSASGIRKEISSSSAVPSDWHTSSSDSSSAECFTRLLDVYTPTECDSNLTATSGCHYRDTGPSRGSEVVWIAFDCDNPDQLLVLEEGSPTTAIEDIIECDSGEAGIQLSNPIEGTNTCLGEGTDFTDTTPLEDNPILIYLGILIKFLSLGVGIIGALVIVIAGIRYSAAQGNPQETAAAKDMILKAVIGMIMYLFSAVIIEWLVPGNIII